MRDNRWMIVVPMALIVVAMACGSPSETPETPEEAVAETEAEAVPDVYDLRGEVTEMPAESGEKMYIRHEAIPDFKGADGVVQGMDSMIMGFRPVDEVSLDGIDVGTKIAFVVEMTWGDEPGMVIRNLEILPPETELDVAY